MKRRYFLLLTIAAGIAACSKNDNPAPEPAPDHFRPATDTSSEFISAVYAYMPAPGQFVNSSMTGDSAGAQRLIGGFSGLLSLGGFGGYVIVGFDHSIENKSGNDLGIYGNPLVNAGQEWSEPGIVKVMQDLNGNGIPDDDAWYELKGSEYDKPETIKNYRITYYNPKNLTDDIIWKDNQGQTGVVLRNMFHAQSYYPAWTPNQDSMSFEGTKLKNTLEQVNDPVYGPGLITNKPFEKGYADNCSPVFLQIRDEEGRGYNAFDISAAVDKQGQPVALPYIDFVKIYTGQNCNGDPGTDPDTPNRMLGEVSTEVSGAVDLHIRK
ncbi:PKD domain-containing protein [Chitinophaga cymbidii]|uniref:PKD domain-containing protein n=1 Tax=Chitinophaga cymbidii TaxID=1096750 RepID=UPI0011BDA85D|nr:PKD domain-containing protein [Chitinophaga cymbidii]